MLHGFVLRGVCVSICVTWVCIEGVVCQYVLHGFVLSRVHLYNSAHIVYFVNYVNMYASLYGNVRM